MAFTLNTSKKSKTTKSSASDENSEFAGIYINVGLITSSEGEDGETEEKFNRLPRGIAVADLVDHPIYASTNPQWAEEAALVNTLMAKIREHASQLEEGEAMPLNFSVQMYKRQEQVEQVASTVDDSQLDSLFG